MTPRRVMYSKTFRDQLADFVERGERAYGQRIAEEKERLVLDFIDTTIATTPAIKRRHAKLGVVAYPISNTPFIVIYDYDDEEVRIFSCMHIGAGPRLDEFDPNSIEW